MNNVQFQKITQSLNYLLQKSSNKKLNKMHLIKLLWAADRYHIRKFGRFVSGDTYVAMPKGPVASLALNILNGDIDFLPDESVNYSNSYFKLDQTHYEVSSLSDTDTDLLSKSDVEALDFSWNKFNNMPRFDLVDFTHKYPEWKRHESVFQNLKTSVPMNPIHFFDNPEDSEKDPFAIDPNLLSANRESFEQSSALKFIVQ